MGTEDSLARFSGRTDLVPFRKPHKRNFDQKDSRAALEKYSLDKLDDKTYLDPTTKKRRGVVWMNWIEFAKSMEVDAEETWIRLCIGSTEAQTIFRVFLCQYVKASTTLRPCLGPEEYVEVRTIDSATTVEDVWCMLVNEADHRVMAPKRSEDRERASFWSVKYASNKSGNGCGPAYEIGRWIPLLADELGLLKTQGFEKSAMQSEDIISTLDILWTEAKHIPRRPSTRLAFHTATVLGGLGGWRPGSLVNIKYKDVQFAWVRDPKVRTRTLPVVYTTIHHVKQQRNHIEREQRSKLCFPMTVIPFKLLCLVTLFTARAIADDAFLADFDSCDMVLNPGPMEEGGSDYVELKWKDEMMDEYIVPITYNAFLETWNRVHFVAGTREKKRPYTMRVGTAGRLNGSLERAMCNFILSHSTDVFERSYQPVQLAEKLAEIAYGEKAKQDEHLWSAVTNASNAFLQRDPNAPLYITQEELDNFETRNDLTDLREQLKVAKQQGGASCREAKAILGRISYVVNSLETLVIQEKRRHYFAEVDRLRALGQSTTHLQDPSAINPRRKAFQASSAVAAKIAPLLTDEDPPAALPDRIVAYLTERPFQDDDDGDDGRNDTQVQLEPNEACGQPRCLFGCGDFANRSALTRHVRKIHMDIFKRPFTCPECKHLGWGECTIKANPGAWSNHIERKHGKLHTPNLQSGTVRQAYCLLCEDYFTERGFVQHLNSRHPASKFCQPFQCPECRRQDKDDSTITDRDAWIAHVREAHEGGEVWGAVLVKDEGMGESIARFKASGNQQRKRHGDSSHGLPLVSARPRKRNCLEQRSTSVDWDWKDEDTPDPHAQEEFWVDGRE